MKKSFFVLTLLFLLVGTHAMAQMQEPVKWSFSSKAGTAEGQVILVITANIDPGWHVYSQFIQEGGPVPTLFTFESSADYKLVGKVEEVSEVIKGFDPTFAMDIAWFDTQAIFEQTIKLKETSSTVTGVLEYMVCDDMQCLPPTEMEFIIPVKITLPKE